MEIHSRRLSRDDVLFAIQVEVTITILGLLHHTASLVAAYLGTSATFSHPDTDAIATLLVVEYHGLGLTNSWNLPN